MMVAGTFEPFRSTRFVTDALSTRCCRLSIDDVADADTDALLAMRDRVVGIDDAGLPHLPSRAGKDRTRLRKRVQSDARQVLGRAPRRS